MNLKIFNVFILHNGVTFGTKGNKIFVDNAGQTNLESIMLSERR